jgi:hypothetical protein
MLAWTQGSHTGIEGVDCEGFAPQEHHHDDDLVSTGLDDVDVTLRGGPRQRPTLSYPSYIHIYWYLSIVCSRTGPVFYIEMLQR